MTVPRHAERIAPPTFPGFRAYCPQQPGRGDSPRCHRCRRSGGLGGSPLTPAPSSRALGLGPRLGTRESTALGPLALSAGHRTDHSETLGSVSSSWHPDSQGEHGDPRAPFPHSLAWATQLRLTDLTWCLVEPRKWAQRGRDEGAWRPHGSHPVLLQSSQGRSCVQDPASAAKKGLPEAPMARPGWQQITESPRLLRPRKATQTLGSGPEPG